MLVMKSNIKIDMIIRTIQVQFLIFSLSLVESVFMLYISSLNQLSVIYKHKKYSFSRIYEVQLLFPIPCSRKHSFMYITNLRSAISDYLCLFLQPL